MALRVGENLKTVYIDIEDYSDTGSIDSEPIPGRKRSVMTKQLVDACRPTVVQRNPLKNMRQLHKTFGISKTSMRRVVYENLDCKIFKLQRDRLFSTASKT